MEKEAYELYNKLALDQKEALRAFHKEHEDVDFMEQSQDETTAAYNLYCTLQHQQKNQILDFCVKNEVVFDDFVKLYEHGRNFSQIQFNCSKLGPDGFRCRVCKCLIDTWDHKEGCSIGFFRNIKDI